MKAFFFVLALFLLYSCSCSKNDPTYSASELWELAYEFDPSIELVPIPNHEADRRVVCENYNAYGEGCVEGSGKRIKVRKVELIVIEFEKQSQAKQVAKKINQWYARNWLFDEVSNEPVLQSFVKEVLGAKPGKDSSVMPKQ